jgi:Cytochrome C'
MKNILQACLLAATLSLAVQAVAADPDTSTRDARTRVDLPDMMKAHMLGNMRDHLQALSEIQTALAKGQLDKASDIAETRIGMSSLESHGASHLAPFMPKGMQDIGTEMHHAASRFAMVASEGDLPRALDALSKVTEQCVACHMNYRVN